jgi:hypothetical protein
MSRTARGKKSSLRYYFALTALGVAGPTVLSIYTVAVWSLTAELGFTNSFPWSAGPLSSWMIWLGLALLSNLVASSIPLPVQKVAN